MRRALGVLAVTGLLACAGPQRTTDAQARSPAPDAAAETTVVQPSRLTPEQVRALQRALGDHGFAVDLSGTFDRDTAAALAQFQRARGLPPTGNLNAPTLQALGVDPGEVSGQPGMTGSGADR